MSDDYTEEEARCLLYIISPPTVDPVVFAPKLEEALGAVPGAVGAFQLRMPHADRIEIAHVAEILQPICERHHVAFVLDVHAELAVDLHADGLHVDFESREQVVDLRASLPEEMVLGVACGNSPEAAVDAGEAGADYVSFGPFFDDPAPSDAEVLSWWQENIVLPCVAVGGVTPENCAELADAGADMVAAIRGVWDWPEGAGNAVKAFDKALTEALQST